MADEFDPLNEAHASGSRAKEYTDQYDVDRWYEKLQDITFKTEFAPVYRFEAEAITCSYQRGKSKLTDAQKAALEKLEGRLEKLIEKFPQGAFVRLSTRSPKDAVLLSPKLYENLEKFINDETEDPNADTVAWYKAAVHTMKVTSGAEAVALLCSSGRSNTDLTAAIDANKSKDEGEDVELDDMHLIVREWTCVEPQMEFRGFCYKRKLRAVCQYFTSCYFPETVENKNEIAKTLVKFFRKSIKDRIPFDNCVIDFAIMPDGPRVVEFNPWYIRTGPVMFKWLDDIQLLKHGNPGGPEGLEFRIIESLELRRAEGFGNVRDKLKMYRDAKNPTQTYEKSEEKFAARWIVA
eukprot:TRINITY_DN7238_c0_g1_i1.p1 TRINITY_DN7238_c0_g1~~TRINITY_DN7238_c0_g1_i1.p1  ORF type:complete len:359 (-),score=61.52 TRINITY_DN7238_c0_g1_i1:115-1164(-)